MNLYSHVSASMGQQAAEALAKVIGE
jgi:hypothetical protein